MIPTTDTFGNVPTSTWAWPKPNLSEREPLRSKPSGVSSEPSCPPLLGLPATETGTSPTKPHTEATMLKPPPRERIIDALKPLPEQRQTWPERLARRAAAPSRPKELLRRRPSGKGTPLTQRRPPICCDLQPPEKSTFGPPTSPLLGGKNTPVWLTPTPRMQDGLCSYAEGSIR